MRNLYLEQIRRDRIQGELAYDPPDGAPGPHALAEGRSELDAVLTDLQCLPELDRAALLMRAQDRLSYEEIGAALKIGAGAAKTKVHRARRKIAELRIQREETREKRHT